MKSSPRSAPGCDDAPTIERMCALLGVSKSGFYDWLHRPLSTAQRRRELLADKIAALFEAVGGIYGYRRIHAELVRAGEHVGPELVRALMRQLDLVAVQPRPYRKTTDPDPYAPDTVDLVRRDFTADKPGNKVVGDITYLRTWQGWLYLVPVRLLYDFLVEEGVLESNPVSRGWHTPGGRWSGGRAGLLVPRMVKLPWIPSEAEWHCQLKVVWTFC
jgi:HTH-like domain